ncbi:MAG: hypothetical protein GY946_30010, partial [bacterium]|nr:hypothetical protein [bacterium]
MESNVSMADPPRGRGSLRARAGYCLREDTRIETPARKCRHPAEPVSADMTKVLESGQPAGCALQMESHMRFAPAFLLLAVFFLAAGCGGGSGGGDGAADPTLTSIAPMQGSAAGGTLVTLTGTEFLFDTAVTFGGTDATAITFVNSTTVTCLAPAGTGTVDVVVTVAGDSATLAAS